MEQPPEYKCYNEDGVTFERMTVCTFAETPGGNLVPVISSAESSYCPYACNKFEPDYVEPDEAPYGTFTRE